MAHPPFDSNIQPQLGSVNTGYELCSAQFHMAECNHCIDVNVECAYRVHIFTCFDNDDDFFFPSFFYYLQVYFCFFFSL